MVRTNSLVLLCSFLASCGKEVPSSPPTRETPIGTRVICGAFHNFILKGDGSLWTWGINRRGDLGDGTLNFRAFPVPVVGLGPVIAASAGYEHSLAVTEDGHVWSWGGNTVGQLGGGGAVDPWGGYVAGPSGPVGPDRSAPALVAGIESAMSVAAGGGYGLALKTDGTVWGWGANAYGELGVGSGMYHLIEPVPIQVHGLSNIKAIAAGYFHSLALSHDGTVWAWGSNWKHQLGSPGWGGPIPHPVPGLTDVVEISAAAYLSLARRSDGTVWQWGDTDWGATDSGSGHEFSMSVPSPTLISGLDRCIGIGAGWNHHVLLRDDGTVWTWGNNWSGQIGDGTPMHRWNQPAQVLTLGDAVGVAAGFDCSFAVRKDGSVWAWGDYTFETVGTAGKFVHPKRPERPGLASKPVAIPGLDNVAMVVAGDFGNALALRSDGTVHVWGNGAMPIGVSAYGRKGVSNVPTVKPGWSSILSLGKRMAVRMDGTVVDWDSQTVAGLSNIIQLDTGFSHGLALRPDGIVLGWGGNEYGQVGIAGAPSTVTEPAPVTGLTDIVAISCGLMHSVALRSDGTVWAWGYNKGYGISSGFLCVGSDQPKVEVPMQVQGIDGVVSIDAGGMHTVARRSTGSVWEWGSHAWWPGTANLPPVPTQVPGLSQIASVSAGGFHSIAVRSDGTVWSWGSNDYGALGRGNLESFDATPAAVPGLDQILSASAGYHCNLALMADGTVLGWGDNSVGQVGWLLDVRIPVPWTPP